MRLETRSYGLWIVHEYWVNPNTESFNTELLAAKNQRKQETQQAKDSNMN